MNSLPPIKDELQPRPKLKRHVESSASDEEIEANSVAIGKKWGAATSLPAADTVVTPFVPTPMPPAPKPPELPPEPEWARVISIRGYIPHYLDDELALRAAQRRVTKTFLIMEALAKAGYHIEEIDMVQDRRKRQKGI